jgi:ubiquinone/menaquinone biosynthesis C-methylase UbiE
LVAVEADEQAATALAEKYSGSNVEVVHGDGAALAFADASFDSAGCFTMLHHVPTVAAQDGLLAEIRRVLRPSGVLVGSDSVASDELARFHDGDTYNPVDPPTFADRLGRLVYAHVSVDAGERLSFLAFRPEKGAGR